MTKLLLSLILLNLTLSCGKGFDKDQKPSNPPTQNAQEVDNTFELNQVYLNLVNEYRIERKLNPLVYSAILEEIAEDHSKGMATNSRPFSHLGFKSRCRKIKKRLAPHKLCGEIIAMGQKNPREVLNSWINSPRHHEEIQQKRYNTTALGIYKDANGVIYWTQIFVEL
jgi:uncharacterized protein YkwD